MISWCVPPSLGQLFAGPFLLPECRERRTGRDTRVVCKVGLLLSSPLVSRLFSVFRAFGFSEFRQRQIQLVCCDRFHAPSVSRSVRGVTWQKGDFCHG